jgi:hypothetical protein
VILIEKDIQGSLKELTTLTEKYKIAIGACGCCDSPYLLNSLAEDFELLKVGLDYNKELSVYNVEEPDKDGCYKYHGEMYYTGNTISWLVDSIKVTE